MLTNEERNSFGLSFIIVVIMIMMFTFLNMFYTYHCLTKIEQKLDKISERAMFLTPVTPIKDNRYR